MYIEKIDSPSDLKKLSNSQLDILSNESTLKSGGI